MTQLARSATQLGTIIRRARQKQGLTQQQLADRLGIRQATISEIESGTPGARLSTIQDILAALGLEMTVAARSKVGKTIADIF